MRIRTSHNRTAFTLLEILLVLAIFVIMAAVSVPLMRTMLGDASATAAADAISGQLAEARARAMDEGRAWRVAVWPNSRAYQLAPEDSADWNGNPAEEVIDKVDFIRGLIPKNTIFGTREEDIFPIEKAGAPTGTWTTVAVFLPDGSARDDGLIFVGTPGIRPMRVSVRALTGTASIESYKGTGQP
ncbi:MAG: prepilin-type N-terminal cleavage/methylation domain-containing protein [Planctomycetes bacterium]|nr:prepilin-type N-terminal cleavage/methylation domain-containing protein [Planctomycetota bacterium]